MDTKTANSILPEKPSKAPIDARRLKYLTIAPPKWGKTTLGCAVEDSLLLATEEGHMFHETHKIIIDSWYSRNGVGVDEDGNTHLSMTEAVEAIVASDRFQFIVIDTADMSAKQCLDYHYKKFGVQHAEDAGTYGKGWDLCLNRPFREQISLLMKSGRGIMFITHTNLVTRKVGGVETQRWETTLPSNVQKFLHTQADVIMHGSFGKLRPGHTERDRIISMDGTNEILAGSRIRSIHFPKRYIVDPDKPWEQWASFFTDPKAADKAEQEYLKAMGRQDKEVVAEEPKAKTISEPLEKEGKKGETAPARKVVPVRSHRRVR